MRMEIKLYFLTKLFKIYRSFVGRLASHFSGLLNSKLWIVVGYNCNINQSQHYDDKTTCVGDFLRLAEQWCRCTCCSSILCFCLSLDRDYSVMQVSCTKLKKTTYIRITVCCLDVYELDRLRVFVFVRVFYRIYFKTWYLCCVSHPWAVWKPTEWINDWWTWWGCYCEAMICVVSGYNNHIAFVSLRRPTFII